MGYIHRKPEYVRLTAFSQRHAYTHMSSPYQKKTKAHWFWAYSTKIEQQYYPKHTNIVYRHTVSAMNVSVISKLQCEKTPWRIVPAIMQTSCSLDPDVCGMTYDLACQVARLLVKTHVSQRSAVRAPHAGTVRVRVRVRALVRTRQPTLNS